MAGPQDFVEKNFPGDVFKAFSALLSIGSMLRKTMTTHRFLHTFWSPEEMPFLRIAEERITVLNNILEAPFASVLEVM